MVVDTQKHFSFTKQYECIIHLSFKILIQNGRMKFEQITKLITDYAYLLACGQCTVGLILQAPIEARRQPALMASR